MEMPDCKACYCHMDETKDLWESALATKETVTHYIIAQNSRLN